MSKESRDFYYRSLFHDDQHDISATGGMYNDRKPSIAGSSLHTTSQGFDAGTVNFSDCLNGLVDYNSLEKAFGMSPSSSEVFSSVEGNQKLVSPEGENLATANSSISSSSTEAGAEEDSGKIKKETPAKGSDDGGEPSKKM